ncbi:MAG: P-type conjugative transfer protein TrbL, partial [bacterium]|nr:P-type conjugative transfer protein TrbL [bacterium]
MRITKYSYLILICSLITVFLILDPVICLADVTKDTASQIVEQFKNKATLYGDIFDNYAQDLLGIILIIEIGFLGIKATLNRSEISEILAQFLFVIAAAAFFLAVINNYQTWTGNIINGLSAISKQAGGIDLENPLYAGFDIAMEIGRKVKDAAWADKIGIIIAGLIIVICFALIGGRVIIIKCEAYLAINAAIILLGFGASSFLREYAINVLRYVLSVAFKLFVMQLVLGVGMSFIADFKINSVRFEDLFILIASAVVLLVLISTLPDTVAGIISGSHVGGGVGLRAATGAVAGAAATGAMLGAKAVGGTANLGATVSRAAKIASLQGHGGVSGTASQLWKSYQEARQDEKRAGVGPSSVG